MNRSKFGTGAELARSAMPQRSAPMARAVPLGRTAQLRRVSANRARQDRQRAKTRPAELAAVGGLCFARVPGVCTGLATDVHHLKPRGRGGRDELPNRRPTCRACHDWIGRNPAEAARLGLVLHSWDSDPVSVDLQWAEPARTEAA